MNKQESISTLARSGNFIKEKGSGTLIGILFVFVPMTLVGFLGESLGSGSTLSNLVIALAYALSLGVATLVMRPWGWSWRDLGLRRPASTRRTFFRAVATMVIAVGAVLLPQVIVLLLVGPAGPASNQSEYNPIRGNLALLTTSVIAAWTMVAFGEEMLFRGFLLNALSRPFLQTNGAVPFAVVASSIVFGLVHISWGWIGVIETTLFGLVLASAYVRFGRNLWITIIAHGLANTLKYLLIFSGTV